MATTKKQVPGVGQVEFSCWSFSYDKNGNAVCEFAEWEEKDYSYNENKMIESYYTDNEKQICSDLAKIHESNYDPAPR